MTLAVVILTYNEARHIDRALESVASCASEVFIVDSGSTDETRSIAETRGARVVSHPFVTQAQQFQWALDNLPITADWIMRLDADEVIEPDLAAEIAARLPRLEDNVTGVNLRRKHIFMGRWIRHGGRYPLTILRIWRRGRCHVEQRWMDEHLLLTSGRAVTFYGAFADANLNDLTFFTDKHNRYATREAIDALNKKLRLFSKNEAVTRSSTSIQVSGKRWIKESVLSKLPFTLASTLYFLYRYFIQLGFLDGREGVIYHFLQGYWYRFLVGAKLNELERALAGMTSKEEMLQELSRLTGYTFDRPAGLGEAITLPVRT
jgi:glycosyltransferase involved in cell wall biosynthesis